MRRNRTAGNANEKAEPEEVERRMDEVVDRWWPCFQSVVDRVDKGMLRIVKNRQ